MWADTLELNRSNMAVRGPGPASIGTPDSRSSQPASQPASQLAGEV
eukprot:COSAG01_NODE_3489_length_6015_cov_4.244422_5_plen_46_part_00